MATSLAVLTPRRAILSSRVVLRLQVGVFHWLHKIGNYYRIGAFGPFLLLPFFFLRFSFSSSFFLLFTRTLFYVGVVRDMTNDVVLSRCLTMSILPGIGRRIIVHYSMHIFQRHERETGDVRLN